MPEKRIHKILKLVMVGVILFLAWILPGIWAEKSGRMQGGNPSGIQTEQQEKGGGSQRQPGKGTEEEEAGSQRQAGKGTEGEADGSQRQAGEGTEEEPEAGQQSQEKMGQEPEAGLEEKNWEKTKGRILIDPGHGGSR